MLVSIKPHELKRLNLCWDMEHIESVVNNSLIYFNRDSSNKSKHIKSWGNLRPENHQALWSLRFYHVLSYFVGNIWFQKIQHVCSQFSTCDFITVRNPNSFGSRFVWGFTIVSIFSKIILNPVYWWGGHYCVKFFALFFLHVSFSNRFHVFNILFLHMFSCFSFLFVYFCFCID